MNIERSLKEILILKIYQKLLQKGVYDDKVLIAQEDKVVLSIYKKVGDHYEISMLQIGKEIGAVTMMVDDVDKPKYAEKIQDNENTLLLLEAIDEVQEEMELEYRLINNGDKTSSTSV